MDILAQDGKNKVHNLTIKEYEKIDNFIVYKIEINAQDCNWVVLRRYREFHRLHEELVNTFGIAWELLPPKKLVGNLKTDHIEKRKVLLEKYLKSVLQLLDEYPRVLIEFLELDQFDVHAVCQQLASDLYEIGDDLLAKGYIFKITPLQIHCINRRLQLPLPTCEGDNPNEDIGHLYSFIQQVPRIMVHPGEELHLFIGQNYLKYDLTVFKSLKYLEIQMCDIELIQGIAYIQANVTEICVHRSLKLLKDFLIGGDNWSQGILMPVNSGKEEVDTVVNQCQPWAKLRRASFSYNDFHSIDFTITLLPNITYLDLSHNLLTEVQYLEELTFLTELNLSYNEIRDLTEFPFRLPSVSKLNVAGNGIRNITGLDKMYCLEELDLSNNCIETVTAILPLGNLPMLRSLHVKGNSLAEFGNHRVRIFSQFEQRASEMLLDNQPPSKREMAKISDMLASQDSFCVIPDDPFPQKPKEKKPVSPNRTSPMRSNVSQQDSSCPSVKAKEDLEVGSAQVDSVKQAEKKLSSSEIPQSSPQGKKRDRIAVIKSHKETSSDVSQPSVVDDGKFREQVEKLREQAGESWLTFFNDLVEEEEGKVNSASIGSDEFVAAEEESEKQAAKDDAVDNEGSMPETIEDNDEIKEKLCEASQETDVTKCNEIGESQDEECKKEDEKEENKNHDIKDVEPVKEPPFVLSVDQIDVDTPNDLKDVIRQLIEEDIDLNKETFLMVDKDGCEEYMMTKDGELLIRVELSSGLPVGSYDLECASDLSVSEDDGKYCLQFMMKTDGNGSESGLNQQTISLFSKNIKDAAGLYILIKSFMENRLSRTSSLASASSLPFAISVSNPYKISQKKLISIFHDYLVDRSVTKKKMALKKISMNCVVETDIPESGDIVLVSWVGCLPYLFPEEEIPICVVMTMTNVYLFRIFLENDYGLNNLNSYTNLKEALHCFYTFRLCSIREIVVGLFDQSLRVEVGDEGPRGTFLFLTRDASKTGQFLDSLFLTMGKKRSGRGSYINIGQQSGHLSCDPSIVYPDESKIDILKFTIKKLGYELADGESFLSYCIVYNKVEGDTNDDVFNDVTLPFLRTVILTDHRLILCEEDYVRWPLPSFITSVPVTPQWIINHIQSIENVVGIDLWDDIRGLQNMTGRYGITFTFEDKMVAVEVNFNNTWNLLFQSLSEREQFVRSISCLWKSRFNQDIKITSLKKDVSIKKTRSSPKIVRGHAKKLSGGVIIPPMQKLDSPGMFINLDKNRLNTLFSDKIARGDDKDINSVVSVISVGCKPYCYPSEEFEVALLLGKFNIYVVVGEHKARFIEAVDHFQDDGETNLYFNIMEVCKLQQVVIGLFDQYFRLEMETAAQTFVFITRNSENNINFIQQLSQNILTLPGPPDGKDEVLTESTSPTDRIFEMYSPKNRECHSQSEFIHPNSNTKFVYPSDETLDKLWYEIRNFLHASNFHLQADYQSVLVYTLLSYCVGDNNTFKSCNLVISENFLCLLNEDIVNYPLPLFVKELPEKNQYDVFASMQISSLLRIEFDEFHSSVFSLVFHADKRIDSCEENIECDDELLKSESVDGDTCLISRSLSDIVDVDLYTWTFKAASYTERDKIFDLLTRMWSNNFLGKSLPVIRRKCK